MNPVSFYGKKKTVFASRSTRLPRNKYRNKPISFDSHKVLVTNLSEERAPSRAQEKPRSAHGLGQGRGQEQPRSASDHLSRSD